jgi:hypothetical protein
VNTHSAGCNSMCLLHVAALTVERSRALPTVLKLQHTAQGMGLSMKTIAALPGWTRPPCYSTNIVAGASR